MTDFMTASNLFLQAGPDSDWLLSVFAGTTAFLVFGAMLLLIIAGWWKVFTKADQPGWAAIIPIYNAYVLLKIVGRPWWWLLLMLIPLVNIVIWLIVCIDTAHSYGKSTFLWGIVLLFLLNGIGFIILGWGGDQYEGPAALEG